MRLRRPRAPEERIRAREPGAAVGTRGEPAPWRRAREGAGVGQARPGWQDARESFVYDEGYSLPLTHVSGARGARDEPAPELQGPMLNPPVWTWEVPAYFWLGGVAAGSSFVALAADLAGDDRSAVLARRVALGAAVPCAPLLIADLGRPARFLNMLRIFKPRSPMSMGAWCLVAFSSTAAAGVAADAVGRPRAARAAGAATAVLGTYLGSYTAALLAATAVPLWARSRALLGPIFVCTAVASGAAANRLALTPGPTRLALGRVETAAMASELVLAEFNERRLGDLAAPLHDSRALRAAKWLVRLGLGGRAARLDRLPSALFLASALLFRFAWIEAGKASARDDEAVARMSRSGA